MDQKKKRYFSKYLEDIQYMQVLNNKKVSKSLHELSL